VTTRDPVVALTFDDGPDPEFTPRLLNVLEAHGAHATFFMIGDAAQKCPELVKKVAEAGHAIGNHAWDHSSFPMINRRERLAQIRDCAKALAPYGEKLFRPPYGNQNLASRLDALWLGYEVVMFNVETDDWCGAEAATIADQIERRIQSGSVVVLHDRLADALQDSYFDREQMLRGVQILLDRLAGRFQFLTLPELLGRGTAHKEIWYKEGDLELLNKLRRLQGPARRYSHDRVSRWRASVRDVFVDARPG
jgi:peptidoglycan/xylan/chitin deacetylase (PgdA/CDA1 family)